MELKELTEKTMKLFNADKISDLKNKIMKCCNDNDEELMKGFCEIVDNDLSKDWMQMIYQYYLADRKEKKQDYTPKCLGSFLSRLCGDSEEIVDMCAGSGALTIQRWLEKSDTYFILHEIDENVIPFLLFNLSIRNIGAKVFRSDVLQDEIYEKWEVQKGEKYGKISCIQSTI